MKRWLYAHRPLSGNPAEFERRLREELPALLIRATESPSARPAGDGSTRLRLPARVYGMTTGKFVRVQTGVATTAAGRVRIPISWRPDLVRHAFPSFDGTVELEPHASDRAQLALVGACAIPLGPVGAAADATVLRGVADRTADWLVERLAAVLTHAAEPAQTIAAQRRLLRVGDIMTPDPLTLDEDLPVPTAALLLFHFDVSGAAVVDAHGGLVGVLSEADVLEKEADPRFGVTRAVRESERRRRARTAGQACTRPARSLAPDTTVHAAAREMLDRDVARLIVIDKSRIAGIVTRHDILRALIRADEEIAQSIRATLADLDEPDVDADVEWGVATLAGTVGRLSLMTAVSSAVAEVDGVMAVESDALEFREDDVTPLLPLT